MKTKLLLTIIMFLTALVIIPVASAHKDGKESALVREAKYYDG